jgi:hypothetical protein
MALVKVTGTPFIRDTNSMAIINTDNSVKEEYYNKAKILSAQKEQINKVNREISELKSELGDIKGLLQQLIKNKE